MFIESVFVEARFDDDLALEIGLIEIVLLGYERLLDALVMGPLTVLVFSWVWLQNCQASYHVCVLH